jgi:hypothetical protein
MKIILIVLFLNLLTNCIPLEWQIGRRNIVQIAPLFCYTTSTEQQCFPTAQQCVEGSYNFRETVMCRAVYVIR